jgi:hypothetical protein
LKDYLTEQPKDDDIKAHWQKLVILAKSFPARYWDKFVKKRARAEAIPGGVTTVPITHSTCKQIVQNTNLKAVLLYVDYSTDAFCNLPTKFLAGMQLPRKQRPQPGGSGGHRPHPGHCPRHHLFLHAYRLLQLGGDTGEVKRKREVARRIWFDRLYLTEQAEDNDIKAHWNKLVILAKSFPARYWDKFVKKRARAEVISEGVTTVQITRSTGKQIVQNTNLKAVLSSVDYSTDAFVICRPNYWLGCSYQGSSNRSQEGQEDIIGTRFGLLLAEVFLQRREDERLTKYFSIPTQLILSYELVQHIYPMRKTHQQSI